MNAHSVIISIGNELLLGRTINSNLGFLGRELARLGIPVHRCIIVKDEASEIAEALAVAWKNAEVVITTGGLGPTRDDITRASLSAFFGKELYFDEKVWDYIQQMFASRQAQLPMSNKAQAMVPRDFEVLENKRGTAPGLHYAYSGRHFFALQGVPHEMQAIFSEQIRPILKSAYPDAREVLQRDIHTFGIGESALAEIIKEDDMPEGITLAWLPQSGRVDLRIYGTGQQELNAAEALIVQKAGKYIWGFDAEEPVQSLMNELKRQKLKLAIAESCTGGLVQKYITDVPGASEHFLGGVVSYHNDAKQHILGVDDSILTEHGAVSSNCARAMAEGVQKLFAADLAISITGIAGPTGGSSEKPVGTVFFGYRFPDKSFEEHRLLFGDRASIRHKAAETAILTLYKALRDR